jgi:hypothetical protein
MSETGASDATANQIALGIGQLRGVISILGGFASGGFTGADIRPFAPQIMGLGMALMSEDAIRDAIRENFHQFQPEIINKLTDPNPTNNLLVQTLRGMNVGQIKAFLEQNPDMMASIQETIRSTTVSQGLGAMQITVSDGLASIRDVAIAELTPAHLAGVDNATLRATIIGLPDDMFREVMLNINEVRAENRLQEISVPDGELGDARAELFDRAISVTGTDTLGRIFNYFLNNPDPYDSIRERIPAIIQERTGITAGETMDAAAIAGRLHTMATQNGGSALAAILSTDESREKFREMINFDFVNRNFNHFRPHLNNFMSDSMLDNAANMLNSVLINFPFIGQLISALMPIIERVAGIVGIDLNGNNGEHARNDRAPDAETPEAEATAPEQQPDDTEQRAALAIAVSGPRIG